jgi:transcriptional regulator with PAS, ATPase and Fis domain
LLESELFGFRRGAFTGATYDKKGLLEEADGGTLFLNEVGDLPLNIQAKLLGVIENHEVLRLGETRSRKIDFRVISATNKNLEEEIKSGRFREDLYYRLNSAEFVLPPLRERKEDLTLLVEYFLIDSGLEESFFKDIDNWSYIGDCLNYNWPGNIREFENEVKKIFSILYSGKEQIKTMRRLNDTKETGSPLTEKTNELEKEEILIAIKKSNYNKKKAAELLGISEATLYRKIKLYQLNI